MRDPYEPQTLKGVIRKTLPLRTFFRRFFSAPIYFPTETVSFEFQEGKRRLAPFVNPRVGSESIERDGYEIQTFIKTLAPIIIFENPSKKTPTAASISPLENRINPFSLLIRILLSYLSYIN